MPRRKINVTAKILQALRKKGPLAWGELQKYSGVSKAALSENLNQLITLGWVETRIDEQTRPPRTIYFLRELEDTNSVEVELPDEIIEEIKQHIKDRPELGYTDYRNFVYDAVIQEILREKRRRKK